jgi:hypothetical protein
MQGANNASIRPVHFVPIRVDDLDIDILEPGFEEGDQVSDLPLETIIFSSGIGSRPAKISNTINEKGLGQHPQRVVILRSLGVYIGIAQNLTPGVQHPIQIPTDGCAKKSQGILTALEVRDQGGRRFINIIHAGIPQELHEGKPHVGGLFRIALHVCSP